MVHEHLPDLPSLQLVSVVHGKLLHIDERVQNDGDETIGHVMHVPVVEKGRRNPRPLARPIHHTSPFQWTGS